MICCYCCYCCCFCYFNVVFEYKPKMEIIPTMATSKWVVSPRENRDVGSLGAFSRKRTHPGIPRVFWHSQGVSAGMVPWHDSQRAPSHPPLDYEGCRHGIRCGCSVPAGAPGISGVLDGIQLPLYSILTPGTIGGGQGKERGRNAYERNGSHA